MKKPIITAFGLCGKSVFLTVDHFHSEGETVHADSIYTEPGGKGFNQAVAAARLGACVNFFTCCGEDIDGETCRDFLLNEKITPYIETKKDTKTAFASILTDKSGANRVTVFRGAADKMSADYVRQNEHIIAQSDLILLNNEYPIEVNLEALRIAEENGILTILNPAPAIETDKEYLKRFSMTTPNENEVLTFTDLSGKNTFEEIADTLINAGYQKVAVTLGGKGVLVLDERRAKLFPAIERECVDSTGAGDTFNGALAVAVSEGKSFDDAVVFAENAASISVGKHFVMNSIPYRNDVISSYQNISPIMIR